MAPDTDPQVGRLFRRLLLAYAIFGFFVLLQPQPTVASGGVGWFAELLQDLHLPAQFTAPGRAEAIVNAALFAPAATLTVLGFRRLSWSEVAVAGFVASLAVEVFQGLFLSDRTAQAIDVVANSGGGIVGALVGALLLARRPRDAQPS